MGYSSRYHLASLVAVFVALAIGILIGVGLAGDVVTSASEELKQSLRSDLDEAEAEIDALDERLARELEFEALAYPALVDRRLAGQRVGLISFGEPAEELVADVRGALEPAGAQLASLMIVATPADVDALLAGAGARFESSNQLASVGGVADAVGAQIARGGGRLLDQLRPVLFTRTSGQTEDIDRFVISLNQMGELDEIEAGAMAAVQRGLIGGLDSAAANVIGVERTNVEPSLLNPLGDLGIPTVDHLDLVAGRVSLVFAMLGAEGDYGVKDDSDEYLPALIGGPAGTP